MKSKELALRVAEAISEKKGNNITILQIQELSLIADYFVLTDGTSRVHTQSISDYVEEELTKYGFKAARREGYPEGKWIVLDFNSVIVHIFQWEERELYNLERLWGDAPHIPLQE